MLRLLATPFLFASFASSADAEGLRIYKNGYSTRYTYLCTTLHSPGFFVVDLEDFGSAGKPILRLDTIARIDFVDHTPEERKKLRTILANYRILPYNFPVRKADITFRDSKKLFGILLEIKGWRWRGQPFRSSRHYDSEGDLEDSNIVAVTINFKGRYPPNCEE